METKSKFSNKLLAILLSVVLVLTSIPIAALNVFAANELSFVVTDSQSNAVSGATVTVLSTKINDTPTDIVSAGNAEETSSTQGKVTFAELNSYFDANPQAEVTVELSVEKANYQSVSSISFDVTANSTEDDLTIELKSNPTVSLSVSGRTDNKVIELYKGSVDAANKISSSGAQVEVGATVIAAAAKNDNDSNYTLQHTDNTAYSADDDYEYFSFVIGDEDFDISFAYSAITYTVTATINGEGSIAEADSNGKISVVKTESQTVITCVPDTYYKLESLEFDGVAVPDTQITNNQYAINNSVINDNNHTVTATFSLIEYNVTASVDAGKGGSVTPTSQIVSAGENATATFNISAEGGYSLYRIDVNNSEADSEGIAYTDQLDNGSLTIPITQDTNVVVYYDRINTELLKDIPIDNVINVTGTSYRDSDGVYYLKSGSATVSPKRKIANPNDATQNILENITKMDAIVNNDGYKGDRTSYSLTKSSVLSSIQVFKKSGTRYNAYLAYGNVAVIFDSTKPTIKNITYNTNYTNEDETITFTVTDPTATVAGGQYASGIKSVVVSANAGELKTNPQTITPDANGNCSFVAPVIETYSGAVEYTITVADNLDNTQTSKFELLNDTVAPSLVSGTGAISFKIENDNVFARVINAISFGKWLNKKLAVTVNSTDSGVGFGGNATASVKFIPDGQTDGTAYSALINDQGVAVIEVEDGNVFYGTVQYQISDSFGNTTEYALVTKDNSNIGNTDSGIVMIEENVPVTPVIDFNNEYKALETTKIYQNGTDYPIVNSKPTIDIDFEDVESGLYSIEVSVNSETPQVVINSLSNNIDDSATKTSVAQTLKEYTYTLDLSNYVPTDDGEYVISAKSTDNSGNVSEIATYTYIIDETAPEIVGFDFSLSQNIDTDKNETTDLFDAVQITSVDGTNNYAFYFMQDVDVTITAADVKQDKETASGVKSIVYVAKGVNINDEEVLISDSGLKDDGETVTFTIPKGFKGHIYAYAIDMVENTPFNSKMPSDYDTALLIADGDYENYVSPDGAVLEDADMHSETSEINFTSIPTPQGTQNTVSEYTYAGEAVNPDAVLDYEEKNGDKNVPLYNSDIDIDVEVVDTYSGIRSVTYTIFEGEETTSKTVNVLNNGSLDNTEAGWRVESLDDLDKNLIVRLVNTISVSGNYNDMVLLIELTDRAGNTSYDYYVFGIDKTKPTISVSYDNNNGDTKSGGNTYFDAYRTATVTVNERNFNAENMEWVIQNLDKTTNGSVPTPKLVNTKLGTGNHDDDTYIFEIAYNTDAIFRFDVSYTDRATNANEAVDYGDSLAPNDFVIDTVNPTITVSYNNNSAQNEKYFKEYRTATITIVEHNFDPARVDWSKRTAANPATSVPAYNLVSENGDTHVYQIEYKADGDYTFDITMEDMSGRKETTVDYGISVAGKEFTVDTTYDQIAVVSGIKDGEVLGLSSDGTVNPDARISITINDINLEEYNVILSRTRVIVDGESKNEEDATVITDQSNLLTAGQNNAEGSNSEFNAVVTSEFVPNASGRANIEISFTIPERDKNNVKNDGVYTLEVIASDLAGNNNENDTASRKINFLVSRFGSVFTISKELYGLITDNDGYHRTEDYLKICPQSVEIKEYNATEITEANIEIWRGNDKLPDVQWNKSFLGTDNKANNMQWHEYTYAVSNNNFVADGNYDIRISSLDSTAKRTLSEKYDICNICFSVDNTAPELDSVNYSTEVKKVALTSNGKAKTDNLEVDFTVKDVIRLDKIEVFIDGSDTPQSTYLFGKDFDKEKAFSSAFNLEGNGDTHDFRIVVTDKAGNSIDTSSEDFKPGFEFFSSIAVSPNQIVLWSHEPVFWIIVGGTAAAAAGIVLYFVIKKRKANEEA